MKVKHGRGIRDRCDFRGCRKKPAVRVLWPDSETACGRLRQTPSEYCEKHLDVALRYAMAPPLTMEKLQCS